ncbi:hypothetical protein FO519_009313 [Halicephalobus sp. NKZ332]|nr:hypothetical protein FO519_009313 [Halicephalobus sp. NKZ332]
MLCFLMFQCEFTSLCRNSKTIKLFLIGCALTCITNLFSAFSHTSINTAVDEVNDYIRTSYANRNIYLDDSKVVFIRGIYNSIYYAGQVAGSVISPRLPDKYGRKLAYILTTAMMTVSCAIQAGATLTNYPEILILGRFVGSLFAPMNDAVMLLYCQETSTARIRGILSSLFTSGYAVMAFLGMMIGMKSMLGGHLTILLALPIPVGIIGCLFLFYLKETPKQDRKAAMNALVFYQGDKPENDEILNNYIRESEEQSKHGSILDLIRVPHLRKALILSNAALIQEAQLASTLIAVTLIVTCLIAGYLLKVFRRRLLLTTIGLISMLGLCIFSVAGWFAKQTAFLKYVAMGGMFGYMACFGLALGPISFSIAPELVPLQYRSSIICMTFSLNSIFVVATNIAMPPLFVAIGSIAFIPLFVVPMALSLFYLFVALPETKDYEVHEIVHMLKNNKLHLENKSLSNTKL